MNAKTRKKYLKKSNSKRLIDGKGNALHEGDYYIVRQPEGKILEIGKITKIRTHDKNDDGWGLTVNTNLITHNYNLKDCHENTWWIKSNKNLSEFEKISKKDLVAWLI